MNFPIGLFLVLCNLRKRGWSFNSIGWGRDDPGRTTETRKRRYWQIIVQESWYFLSPLRSTKSRFKLHSHFRLRHVKKASAKSGSVRTSRSSEQANSTTSWVVLHKSQSITSTCERVRSDHHQKYNHAS